MKITIRINEMETTEALIDASVVINGTPRQVRAAAWWDEERQEWGPDQEVHIQDMIEVQDWRPEPRVLWAIYRNLLLALPDLGGGELRKNKQDRHPTVQKAARCQAMVQGEALRHSVSPAHLRTNDRGFSRR